MADIIDFREANNKLWERENKETTDTFVKIMIELTIMKLHSINYSGDDPGNPELMQNYEKEEIMKALDHAIAFIDENYEMEEINSLTSIHDELSNLVIKELTGKERVTLESIDKRRKSKEELKLRKCKEFEIGLKRILNDGLITSEKHTVITLDSLENIRKSLATGSTEKVLQNNLSDLTPEQTQMLLSMKSNPDLINKYFDSENLARHTLREIIQTILDDMIKGD